VEKAELKMIRSAVLLMCCCACWGERNLTKGEERGKAAGAPMCACSEVADDCAKNDSQCVRCLEKQFAGSPEDIGSTCRGKALSSNCALVETCWFFSGEMEHIVLCAVLSKAEEQCKAAFGAEKLYK